MERYEPEKIEAKWQEVWERERAYAVPNPDAPQADDERKTYVLEMLPYPSGELHMGHVLNYTLGDVVAHLRRRSASACCARWATTRSGCPPRTRPSGRAGTRARSPRRTSPPSARRPSEWVDRLGA